DDEEQQAVRLAGCERLDRIDRIRCASPIQLDVGNPEGGIPPNCELQHGEPSAAVCEPSPRLVGWVIRRHEVDSIERQRLADLLRTAQMPEVDRIERSTENSEALLHLDVYSRICPEPYTRYL